MKRKRKNELMIGIFLTVSFILLSSCYRYSSKVIPPSDGRIYIIVQNSSPVIYKDGYKLKVSKLPENQNLLCDPKAVKYAKRAKKKYELGSFLDILSTGLLITLVSFEFIYFTTPALQSGSPIIDMFMFSVGYNLIGMLNAFSEREKTKGLANVVDAINAHNDNSECIK